MQTTHNWRNLLRGIGHLAPRPVRGLEVSGDVEATAQDQLNLDRDWAVVGGDMYDVMRRYQRKTLR
jgi:hypothetical protein